jgi:tetratricopeptide (TPR) repeat protein
MLAGDQAEAAFAHAEAERHYRTAVQLARELGDVAAGGHALEKLGGVLTILGRYDEALAELEEAVQRYVAVRDAEGQRRAVDQIGKVHYRQGTFEAGIDRLQQTLRSLGNGAPTAGLAQLYLTLAYLYFRTGRHGDQLEAAQRAADLAEAIGDRRLQVQAQLEQAYALPFMGRSSKFEPTLKAVAQLAEEVDDRATLFRTLCAVADSYSAAGEFERGTDTLGRALDIAQHLRDPSRIAFVTRLVGRDAYWRGEWNEAARLFEQSLGIYRELGARADCMLPLFGLGAVHMGRGEWETGTEALDEHLRLARQIGDFRWLPSAIALLAERDLLQGRPQDSRSRLQDALDLPPFDANAVEFVAPIVAWTELALGNAAQALAYIGKVVAQARSEEGDQRVLVDALRAQGMVLTHLQRWEDAERSFEDALARLQRIPYVYGKAHVLFRYGAMLKEKGEPERAKQLLKEALAISRRLGARPYIQEVERVLSA